MNATDVSAKKLMISSFGNSELRIPNSDLVLEPVLSSWTKLNSGSVSILLTRTGRVRYRESKERTTKMGN